MVTWIDADEVPQLSEKVYMEPTDRAPGRRARYTAAAAAESLATSSEIGVSAIFVRDSVELLIVHTALQGD